MNLRPLGLFFTCIVCLFVLPSPCLANSEQTDSDFDNSLLEETQDLELTPGEEQALDTEDKELEAEQELDLSQPLEAIDQSDLVETSTEERLYLTGNWGGFQSSLEKKESISISNLPNFIKV
ncbi:hypothetical protein IQ218_16640 [Synechocystis salina LEGE 06099]|uniref:hypothetical protein n=1 Tax=Synechocystis salina TaxID=945780 RepID=UPI0018805AB9|nr:hypothetical protein [Synechocystis salina]MBE9204762.1 hypothetical protein [Synechocystis salina LEGE 06099]